MQSERSASPGKEKGHRYDVSELKAISSGEFEQLLVARRDLIGNESFEVSTRPDEEVIVKSVTEYTGWIFRLRTAAVIGFR